MSLERRSIRGAAVAGLAVVVSVGQSIVLVPILLNHWGKARYAAWIALAAVVGTVLSLDSGHQNFIGGELAKAYAKDPRSAREPLASALKVGVLLGVIEVLAASALVALGLVPRLAGVAPAVARANDVDWTFFVLVALWVLPGTLGGLLVKLYPPSGRFEESQWWGIGGRILQTGSVVIVAYLGGSLLAAALTSTLAMIAFTVAQVTAMRYRFAELWPFWRGGSFELGWRNLLRSLVLTATQWLIQMQSNWLVIIVASRLGDTAIAMFATVRTVANAFLQGIGVLFMPLGPEVVRFAVRAEHHKLRETLGACWLVGGLAVNLGIVATIPFLEPLYRAWTRGVLSFELPLFLALAASVSLRALGAPLLNLLAGLNALRAQSVIAVLQTTTVCLLAFALLRGHGVVAAGWAVAAGEAVGSVGLAAYFVTKAMRAQGGEFPVTTFSLGLASVASLGLAFVLLALGQRMLPSLVVGAVGTLYFQFSIWRALDANTRARLRGMIPVGRRAA
jgi:O-antigen/teichoic acid export membrane protein